MFTSINLRKYLRERWSSFKKGSYYCWEIVCRTGLRSLFVLILLIALESILPLLQLYFFKNIIDLLTAYKIDLKHHLYFFLSCYGLTLVLLEVVPSLSRLIRSSLGEKSMVAINTLLLDKLRSIPGLEFFDDPEYRNRLETLQERTGWLPIQMIEFISCLMADIGRFIGLFLLIFSTYPLLSLVIIISIIPYAISLNTFNAIVWSYEMRTASLRRFLGYIRNIALSKSYAKEVRLFGLSQFVQDKYHQSFKKLFSAFYRIQKAALVAILPKSLIAGLIPASSYCWLVWQIGQGAQTFTVGEIALLLTSSWQLSQLSQSIVAYGTDTLDLWRMAKDFYVFMQKDSSTSDGAYAAVETGFKKGTLPSIEFKDVHFSYPNQEQAVLKGITFKIKPGEKLALVGENGAGKSTIVKLLCRFYRPTKGQILWDGQDIQNFDILQLRKEIAAVFQNFGRYHLTLADNVILREERKEDTKGLFQKELAKVLNWVERLPEKEKSILVPEFGGIDLSEGQWQSIALARAFFKESGSFLILDEPTASLDIKREEQLFSDFSMLCKSKTALIISHRFSTVKIADRILVLKEGKILEEGTHLQLLEHQGLYAEMYRLQAASYLEDTN